jgi:hypothetical protein
LGNLLSSEELLGVSTDGDSTSAQAHIDGGSTFANRNLALRFTLLAGDSRRENRIVIIQQIDEQHCEDKHDI